LYHLITMPGAGIFRRFSVAPGYPVLRCGIPSPVQVKTGYLAPPLPLSSPGEKACADGL